MIALILKLNLNNVLQGESTFLMTFITNNAVFTMGLNNPNQQLC